jgi:transcription-repair coupling factor (superfamily II helicase)
MRPPVKPPPDLLQQITTSAPMAAKLAQLRAGEAIVFEHVTEGAQPFLAALIARQVKRRLWIVCANVRAQETFHNELLNWFPDALFFPEADLSSVEGAIPDPENAAERLGIVQNLSAAKGRQIVVLTKGSLDDAIPSPQEMKKREVKLARGVRLDREGLIAQLDEAGYEHVAQVTVRGQYAVRGGILDVFSFHHALPVRIELFDDEIESMREFDVDTQTSVRHLDVCTLLLGETATSDAGHEDTCRLRDLIRDDDLTIDAGADWLPAQVRILEASEGVDLIEDYSTAFPEHGLGEFEAGDFVVDALKRERFFDQLREWREGGWSVHIFCNNEGEIERLRDLVPAVEADPLHFTIGTLAHGFAFPSAQVAVLSDAELFGRYRNNRARRLALRRAREQASRTQIDFSELNEDDIVVHLEHGIGRYEGMKLIPHSEGRAPARPTSPTDYVT